VPELREGEEMKITISVLLILFLAGCITMNPCPYCHQSRVPDIEQNEGKKIGDGFVRFTQTKVWIEYQKDEK